MDDFISSGESSEIPDMGSFDPSGTQAGMPQMPGRPQEDFGSGNRENSSFGGMGGFGMGSSDVKLQYIDDNTSSYSNIWNNAKTDITAADQTRLIDSLEKLTNGEDIESVVNIEQVIRYFVVHNYVCNGDSYTGSMIHNYYLYEGDGQMSMIPWDYNLAYGTFQGGDAQSTVNTPIDAPVSGGSGEDRPMWSWILSDEAYTELYHQYFSEFLATVDITGIIDNAYDLLKSYVEKDPTAFYSYDEFETGVDTLRQFCTLRSESISRQLANGETTSDMSYVDASGLTLSDMGSMGMGGGFGGSVPGNRGDSTNQTPNMGEPPEGFDPSHMQGGFQGELPEGFDPPENGVRPSRDNAQVPEGDARFNGSSADDTASGSTGFLWLAGSLLILGTGLLIVKRYQR